MKILEVTNLSKKFGNFYALKNVSFSAKRGEILGILGPNGSGKTTLVKCICGMLIPDKGKVFIDGKDVTGNYKEALKYISFPFVRVPSPRAKAIEILMYNIKLFDLHSDYRYLCKTLNFEDFDKELQVLSSGNLRKLEVIIGLLFNPPIFIMDETTNGLDYKTAISLLKEIKRICKKNETTVLFASHIMDHIERVANKIVIINKGRILAIGSLKKLKKEADIKEYVKIKFSIPIREIKIKNGIPIRIAKNEYEIVTEDYKKLLAEVGKLKIIKHAMSIEVKKPKLQEVYSYFVSKSD